MGKTIIVLVLVLIVDSIFIVCGNVNYSNDNEEETAVEFFETVSAVLPIYAYDEPLKTVESPTIEVRLFSDEDVDIIAQTLAGECYDDKLADKRRVAEVIVNRVSDGWFGKSVVEVVKARGQFCGYWNQSRPVSESDVKIAEETLCDWYANDCKALSEYLFFCAGPNRENVFRVEY